MKPKPWPVVRELLLALIAIGTVYALAVAGYGAPERARDIVFTDSPPACKGGVVLCARTLWFNGDWSGTRLCKAHVCVPVETVFEEAK